jgi:orotate phosphoribosyltransferase
MNKEFLKSFSETKIKLSWGDFDIACEKAVRFIQDLNVDKDSVSLLGMASGALPFLTKISHLTGIRDISIVQAELTLSDNPHDRGNVATVTLEAIRKDKTNFILLEDIIHTGKSIKTAIDLLHKENKNISGIVSLVATSDFSEKNLDCPETPIYAIYQIPENGWIEFPWEN